MLNESFFSLPIILLLASRGARKDDCRRRLVFLWEGDGQSAQQHIASFCFIWLEYFILAQTDLLFQGTHRSTWQAGKGNVR